MSFDFSALFENEDEKPLDRFVTDGGYAKIFRTIACVGDSLSSGEFESLYDDGSHGWHDMFEFSWGQFMARTNGTKVYNFSRGGMTAREYCQSFAENNGFWNDEYKAQAYIVALGCNDFNPDLAIPYGDIETDVDFSDWKNTNDNTFIGGYAKIIQRYKEIQPRAKFFLVTMPNDTAGKKEIMENQRDAVYKIAGKFDNCYVIDLYKYAPAYDDKFKSKFFMLGHMNPMGYLFTADMISSYIDYIVRHNTEDFKQIGFIGTDLHI